MNSQLTENFVSGVLAYVCVQTPTNKYQSDLKEYKVSIIVDEDTADAWEERFPKQSAKVVKTQDFEGLYKIKPPYPEEKKQYVLTIKKAAQYQDGNPIPDIYKPKVLERNADGTATDVTETKLPANGSEGKVSFDVRSNDYGSFAGLKNVLVESMIEYKKEVAAGDEFGVAVASPKAAAEADFDVPSEAIAPSTKKSPARAKKVAPVVEEDSEDDLPFN